MDIQVGDRVTYEISNGVGGKIKRMTIITEDNEAFTNDTEIVKIERPKYEVVEEKKELLTEEEKQFLKYFLKCMEYYSNNIWEIKFDEESIDFYSFRGFRLVSIEYPSILAFDNVKSYRYGVQELGLRES